jgi:orotate phosphoribosyltransferase-like protein
MDLNWIATILDDLRLQKRKFKLATIVGVKSFRIDITGV